MDTLKHISDRVIATSRIFSKLFRLPRMKAEACTRPSVNQLHGLFQLCFLLLLVHSLVILASLVFCEHVTFHLRASSICVALIPFSMCFIPLPTPHLLGKAYLCDSALLDFPLICLALPIHFGQKHLLLYVYCRH